MLCKLCKEELKAPEIICPICDEKQTIIDYEFVNYSINLYKEYQNKIIQYKKDEYYDNYKTNAIKKTSIKIFEDIVSSLKYQLEFYANIDVSKIQIEEYCVDKPRPCELDSNKICDYCMNC